MTPALNSLCHLTLLYSEKEIALATPTPATLLGWLHCCTSQTIPNVTLSIIEYLAHVMKIYSLTDTSRNSNFMRTGSCSKRKMKPCWKQLYFPNGQPSLLLPALVLPQEMWRDTAASSEHLKDEAEMYGWTTQICQVEPLGLEPVTCSHNGALQLSFLPCVHLVDLLWIYQYVVKAHCQQVTF